MLGVAAAGAADDRLNTIRTVAAIPNSLPRRVARESTHELITAYGIEPSSNPPTQSAIDG
jgi:hypothetical protein